jgi:hypothetical protein
MTTNVQEVPNGEQDEPAVRNSVATFAAKINQLLADALSLYLKTKNFHWHVSGPISEITTSCWRSRQAAFSMRSTRSLSASARPAARRSARLGRRRGCEPSPTTRPMTSHRDAAGAQALRRAWRRCDGKPSRRVHRRGREARVVPARGAAALIVDGRTEPKVQNTMPRVRSGSVCARTQGRSNS